MWLMAHSFKSSVPAKELTMKRRLLSDPLLLVFVLIAAVLCSSNGLWAATQDEGKATGCRVIAPAPQLAFVTFGLLKNRSPEIQGFIDLVVPIWSIASKNPAFIDGVLSG